MLAAMDSDTTHVMLRWLQVEVLLELTSMRLEASGSMRSKYSALLILEGIKCALPARNTLGRLARRARLR